MVIPCFAAVCTIFYGFKKASKQTYTRKKVVITVNAVHAYRCSLKSREARVVASTVADVEI